MFEEDASYKEYWGVKSGSETSRVTGGVDGTPHSMRFRNLYARPYIFSTTALMDDPSIDWVKARANYRKVASSDFGTVTRVVLGALVPT